MKGDARVGMQVNPEVPAVLLLAGAVALGSPCWKGDTGAKSPVDPVFRTPIFELEGSVCTGLVDVTFMLLQEVPAGAVS